MSPLISPHAAGAHSITTHADTASFRRLFEKSSQVEGKLKTALRRNIRIAAETLADAARLEVTNSPGGTVSAKPHHKGLRLAIAAGIKVKVMTGARAGVTIVAGTSQMPAGEESLVRAWEGSKGWRHPVFGTDKQIAAFTAKQKITHARGGHGRAWTWTRQGAGPPLQLGHPYFAKPIYDGRSAVTTAVEAAMREAAQSLEI
jgi:hypothetical protein